MWREVAALVEEQVVVVATTMEGKERRVLPVGQQHFATSYRQYSLDHGLDGPDHQIDPDLPLRKDGVGASGVGPVGK